MNATIPETMIVGTVHGVITFEKCVQSPLQSPLQSTLQSPLQAPLQSPLQTYLFVLPPHDDPSCQCSECELYRVASEYKRDGWRAVKFY